MKTTVTSLAVLFLSALLIFPAAPRADDIGDRIFTAKIKMQFGLEFDIDQHGEVLFAFQKGMGEKSRKYLSGLPLKFSKIFKDLVGTSFPNAQHMDIRR